MNKVGIKMSLLMAVTLSFCLSLTGNLTSGEKFAPVGFLITFAASFVISLVIGLIIPMSKVEGGAVRACGMDESGLPARLLKALISDAIYTPVITFAMIALVRKMAFSHGEKGLPPFGVMFGKSLVISLIVAYVIIFIVSPAYLKLAMKNNGSGGPQGGPPANKENQ